MSWSSVMVQMTSAVDFLHLRGQNRRILDNITSRLSGPHSLYIRHAGMWSGSEDQSVTFRLVYKLRKVTDERWDSTHFSKHLLIAFLICCLYSSTSIIYINYEPGVVVLYLHHNQMSVKTWLQGETSLFLCGNNRRIEWTYLTKGDMKSELSCSALNFNI